MDIKQDIRNEIFGRQELKIDIETETSPSFNEVKKKISEKFGKPDENIDILSVKGAFGTHIFHVDAFIYDNKEQLEKMQNLRKTKKQKKQEKEGKKKAEEEAKKETEGEKEEKQEEENKAVKGAEEKEEAVEEKKEEEKQEEEKRE